MEFRTKIAVVPYAKWVKHNPNPAKVSTTLFDCVAGYLAYSEKLVRIEELPVGVTEEGKTVIDKSKRNARCAMGWKDLGAFEDHLVDRICGDGQG